MAINSNSKQEHTAETCGQIEYKNLYTVYGYEAKNITAFRKGNREKFREWEAALKGFVKSNMHYNTFITVKIILGWCHP